MGAQWNTVDQVLYMTADGMNQQPSGLRDDTQLTEPHQSGLKCIFMSDFPVSLPEIYSLDIYSLW